MYMCRICRTVFADPSWESEIVGEYQGQPARETWATCPDCGSPEIEEAHECPTCGEYTTDEYCSECIAFMISAVSREIYRIFRNDATAEELVDLLEYVVNEHSQDITESIKQRQSK